MNGVFSAKKIWLSVNKVAISGKGIPESLNLDHTRKIVTAKFDSSSPEIKAIAAGKKFEVKTGVKHSFMFTCRPQNATGWLQETSGLKLEDLEVPAQNPECDQVLAWYERQVAPKPINFGTSKADRLIPEQQFEGVPLKLVTAQEVAFPATHAIPKGSVEQVAILDGGELRCSPDLNGKKLHFKFSIPVERQIISLPEPLESYKMHIIGQEADAAMYWELEVQPIPERANAKEQLILLKGLFEIVKQKQLSIIN